MLVLARTRNFARPPNPAINYPTTRLPNYSIEVSLWPS